MKNGNSNASSYTDNLRERLRLHGITLGALSRQSGINRSQIARWMNTDLEPNWRSIVRIEEAVAAIAPSAALSVSTGSKTLPDDAVRELTRLREFVEEFRSLIDMYDRTPPRWKYFQTQWLWMYARGMVEGEVPASVKTRRLAELHTKEETGDEEAAMLRETDKTIVHLVRGELYGGPGDGGCVHLRLPLRDNIVVRLPSTGGETLDANYRRAAGTLGDIVQIPMDRICRDDDIENAFSGKKSAKYIYVSPSED